MTMDENDRLLAWGQELRRVHVRLREALEVTQERLTGDRDAGAEATRELLLFCHGFCTALEGHHRGEDRTLFPALEQAHPDLAPTLRSLQQDHSMIAHLLDGLSAAVDRTEPPAVLQGHLDGVAAVMESHFRYEERQLLAVLDTLALDADPRGTLGPL